MTTYGAPYWKSTMGVFFDQLLLHTNLMTAEDLVKECLCNGKKVKLSTMKRYRSTFISKFKRDVMTPMFKGCLESNWMMTLVSLKSCNAFIRLSKGQTKRRSRKHADN